MIEILNVKLDFKGLSTGFWIRLNDILLVHRKKSYISSLQVFKIWTFAHLEPNGLAIIEDSENLNWLNIDCKIWAHHNRIGCYIMPIWFNYFHRCTFSSMKK